jgi:nucleoside triphosphate diphosphatase
MKQHPIEKLIEVMAQLRNPDGGCPWDLQQDFKSIAPYTIEEAYEVADAIAKGDMTELQEELGDLLLQPIYHAQMAKEAGHFDINDVIDGITNKMIERHPHVFGDKKAKSASDVNVIWDNQKAKEKTHDSVLDAVPKALPALLRAKKLQSKAAKVGFEWKKLDDVLDKLEEELGELREAVASGDVAHKQEEFGDLLFVLVNFARMKKRKN